jgi:hypothetical protein
MRSFCSLVKRAAYVAFFVFILSAVSLNAQDQTVGLFQYDSEAFDGYTFFAPSSNKNAYLIDMYGRLVHIWESSYNRGMAGYLLENGSVLLTAKMPTGISQAGGAVEEIAWDGTLIWHFDCYGSDYAPHHDIEPMPNGNVLIVTWEFKTKEEAIAAGRDSTLIAKGEVWPTLIMEVEPTGPTSGDIVWEWHLWDHVIQDFDSTKDNYGVVGDHPELVDLNYVYMVLFRPDWIHMNSIDYNPELDQILTSSRFFSEIWIIDHSTTTEEAAGHTGGNCGMGGDILWRWGNPETYRAGDSSDMKLFRQHDANWIKPGLPGEGNILILNNGNARPEVEYSSVDELIPPVDENGCYPQPAPGTPHGPEDLEWTYVADPPTDFYALRTSSAQRLPNGNTLIDIGPKGTFFEVTPDGETVWKYINPMGRQGATEQGANPRGNGVFKCSRFAADFAGFEDYCLSASGPLETYPISITGTSHHPQDPSDIDPIIIATKITDDVPISTAELRINTGTGYTPVSMYDDGYHHDGESGDSVYAFVLPPLPEGTEVSYYIYAANDSFEHVKDPPYATITVYSFVVGSRPPTVLINEFMADNQNTVQDEASDYEDWFELYNTQAQPISLSGMYLTDDYYDPVKWLLPDTVIPPYGYLLFWADDEEGEGPLHTNFTLDEGGEVIGLFEAQRFGVVTVDWQVFDLQSSDVSSGRCPDGALDWRFFGWDDASPGDVNYICGDAMANCGIELADVIYLARYVMEDGDPPPDPIFRGNADGENSIDVLDLIHIANYYMKSGPSPHDCGNYAP